MGFKRQNSRVVDGIPKFIWMSRRWSIGYGSSWTHDRGKLEGKLSSRWELGYHFSSEVMLVSMDQSGFPRTRVQMVPCLSKRRPLAIIIGITAHYSFILPNGWCGGLEEVTFTQCSEDDTYAIEMKCGSYLILESLANLVTQSFGS